MKNRSLLLLALFSPLLVLTIWAAELEIRYIMSPKVLISATGYDPRDLLSGHYLNLRLDWNNTDCTQFEGNICDKKNFNKRYRYYLPEKEAKALDKVLARQNLGLLLEFSYTQGREPILRNLFIENLPWKEWTQKNL